MPRKGQCNTEETKEKMREACKTRLPPSEETKRKISNAHKGMHPSEETKEKIRLSHAKGYYTHTEEVKRKISENNRRRKCSELVRERMIQYNREHIFTTETRMKMRQSRFIYLNMLDTKGWFLKTSLEKKFSTLLNDIGCYYDEQYHLGSKWYDFYISQYNLIIEVHGSFWHADPRFWSNPPPYKRQKYSIENDKIKMEIALSKGYRYAVFWEYDVNNFPDVVLLQLKELFTQ